MLPPATPRPAKSEPQTLRDFAGTRNQLRHRAPVVMPIAGAAVLAVLPGPREAGVVIEFVVHAVPLVVLPRGLTQTRNCIVRDLGYSFVDARSLEELVCLMFPSMVMMLLGYHTRIGCAWLPIWSDE
jgi:hypothetical protein